MSYLVADTKGRGWGSAVSKLSIKGKVALGLSPLFALLTVVLAARGNILGAVGQAVLLLISLFALVPRRGPANPLKRTAIVLTLGCAAWAGLAVLYESAGLLGMRDLSARDWAAVPLIASTGVLGFFFARAWRTLQLAEKGGASPAAR